MQPHSFEVSGAVTSPADPRDYKDTHVRNLLGSSGVPAHQDTNVPTQPTVPVIYQGQTPSCVPSSRTWGFHYKYFLENGTYLTLSPRMGYALDKAADGVPNEQGTFPRTDLAQFQKLGECSTEDFPNDVTLPLATYQNASLIPTQAAIDALRYNNIQYISVATDPDSIKAAIDDWKVVFLLVQIDAQWWTAPNGTTSWDAKDVLPVRPPTVVTSGHQIAIYGYDENFYYFANSFGNAWGNNGFGTMPIKAYQPFVKEAWSIEALPQDVVQGLETVIQQTTPASPTKAVSVSTLQTFINWLKGLVT